MKGEIYKMIYVAKIDKKLKFGIEIEYGNKKIKKEIESENIRILGHYFFKHNKNKAKLIINNKKYELKEIINSKKFKDDKIKIKMLLSKELSDIKCMFKNCYKLKEILTVDNTINFINEEPKEFENNYNDYNFDHNKDNYDLNSDLDTDIDYTTVPISNDNCENND